MNPYAYGKGGAGGGKGGQKAQPDPNQMFAQRWW